MKDLSHQQFLAVGWSRLLGIEEEPGSYEAWLGTVHPSDRSRVDDAMGSVQSDDVGRHRLQLEYRGGIRESQWLLLRAELLGSRQESRHVVATALDVTAQRTLAQVAASAASDIRSIADAAPILIWTTDGDGNSDWFNRRWLEFTGNTMESALAEGRFGNAQPDDREPALTAFRAASEQRDSIELEYQLRNGQGEYRWMLDRSSPRYDANGQFIGYVGICLDITHQREFRDRLADRENVMRQLHAISEREKSFLAAGIHDGLLQDIVGVEMLLHECDSLDRDVLRSRLERAQATLRSAIGHGRKLISELRPVILDHRGLVSAIEVYAAELASRSGLETRVVSHLKHEIAGSVWSGNVFQIVQEALNNIEAHSGATRATVEVSRTELRLDVVVTDRGVGFDLAAISDSFGLRRMQDRAAIYQGTARVESELGRGTTVKIQIPLPPAIA